MTHFDYKLLPLDEGRNEVRLVDLLPEKPVGKFGFLRCPRCGEFFPAYNFPQLNRLDSSNFWFCVQGRLVEGSSAVELFSLQTISFCITFWALSHDPQSPNMRISFWPVK